jgi:tetratricopeptide (TPR) repeat protein
VFFDYQSIDSGNFEKVIPENIRARAHFLVILTPSALEKCNQPGDWLRREIETAIDEKRNIVPLMLESFDFGSPSTKQVLTGKLAVLNQYNGLQVPSEYFLEAMDRLRNRYLNVAVCDISLPVLNIEAQEITEIQKTAASEAPPVENEELTAQIWLERGYLAGSNYDIDEAIRCFSESILLKQSYEAYFNRGIIKRESGDIDGAIQDYDMAIQINPDQSQTYNNRGNARRDKGDLHGAMADYDAAMHLNIQRPLVSL